MTQLFTKPRKIYQAAPNSSFPRGIQFGVLQSPSLKKSRNRFRPQYPFILPAQAFWMVFISLSLVVYPGRALKMFKYRKVDLFPYKSKLSNLFKSIFEPSGQNHIFFLNDPLGQLNGDKENPAVREAKTVRTEFFINYELETNHTFQGFRLNAFCGSPLYKNIFSVFVIFSILVWFIYEYLFGKRSREMDYQFSEYSSCKYTTLTNIKQSWKSCED